MPNGQHRDFARLKPALRPEVRYRPERAGAILFHASTFEILAANRTGRAVLERLNGKHSCAEILCYLERRFTSVPRRTLQRDLRKFLDDLANADLLTFD